MRYAHSNDDAKRRAVQRLPSPANDNAKPGKEANDNSDKTVAVMRMQKKIAV